jgi:hypothetical protein
MGCIIQMCFHCACLFTVKWGVWVGAAQGCCVCVVQACNMFNQHAPCEHRHGIGGTVCAGMSVIVSSAPILSACCLLDMSTYLLLLLLLLCCLFFMCLPECRGHRAHSPAHQGVRMWCHVWSFRMLLNLGIRPYQGCCLFGVHAASCKSYTLPRRGRRTTTAKLACSTACLAREHQSAKRQQSWGMFSVETTHRGEDCTPATLNAVAPF